MLIYFLEEFYFKTSQYPFLFEPILLSNAFSFNDFIILSIVRLERPVCLITSSFIAFLLVLKTDKTENSSLDNSPS